MMNDLEGQASWQDGARQMNECDYLFLRSIGEPEELTLALIVAEAKPQSPILSARSGSPIEHLTIGARPIQEDENCRVFQVVFEAHAIVSYSVLNEIYGTYPKAPETFTGQLFRVFLWSHLLEHTRRITHATDLWPGPLMHYEIVCCNHVIDVICTQPPKIELLIR